MPGPSPNNFMPLNPTNPSHIGPPPSNFMPLQPNANPNMGPPPGNFMPMQPQPFNNNQNPHMGYPGHNQNINFGAPPMPNTNQGNNFENASPYS